jgi:hypothetical protein
MLKRHGMGDLWGKRWGFLAISGRSCLNVSAGQSHFMGFVKRNLQQGVRGSSPLGSTPTRRVRTRRVTCRDAARIP